MRNNISHFQIFSIPAHLDGPIKQLYELTMKKLLANEIRTDTYSIENLKMTNDAFGTVCAIIKRVISCAIKCKLVTKFFLPFQQRPEWNCGLATVCARAVPDPSQFDPKIKIL